MNNFTLQYFVHRLPDNFPICGWISSAILRHVVEIDVNIHYLSCNVRLTMPIDIFSSKTLTSLKLQGFMNLVLLPPGLLVCLPCLRTCLLGRVCFDDESATRLFRSSCCPALEDLELSECSVAEGVKLLDISSRTLKKLSIDELQNVYQLVLDVPNLVSFTYFGPPPSYEFRGLNLKRVVDAWIYCNTESYARDRVVVELVCAIRYVPKLALSCETMEAFIRSGNALPKFNNLTSLEFVPISSRSWMLLPTLLDNSPRLQFLTLYHGDDDVEEDDPDGYIFPERVPACVALHLREVEFQYSFTLDYDRKLVNYFLKYAKNLKRMKITSNLSWRSEQLNDERFETSSADIVFQGDDGED